MTANGTHYTATDYARTVHSLQERLDENEFLHVELVKRRKKLALAVVMGDDSNLEAVRQVDEEERVLIASRTNLEAAKQEAMRLHAQESAKENEGRRIGALQEAASIVEQVIEVSAEFDRALATLIPPLQRRAELLDQLNRMGNVESAGMVSGSLDASIRSAIAELDLPRHFGQGTQGKGGYGSLETFTRNHLRLSGRAERLLRDAAGAQA